MNKIVGQLYHCNTDDFLFLNVTFIQMTETSPRKKAMKFKKEDPHLVFPYSSVTSNIDHIKDIEIGHVDQSKFLKRVEQLSSYRHMESIINSSIH